MAMAKRDVRVALIELFDQYMRKSEDGSWNISEVRKPYSISKNFIEYFRVLLKHEI